MVGISRPVVKHSFLVKQTEDIPGILKESLLAGGQRPTGAGSGRFAEGYSQSGEKLPYVWPDAVSMRSYNPTTSGHKGQIKRALQTLVAAKNRSYTLAVGQSIRSVKHSCVPWSKS